MGAGPCGLQIHPCLRAYRSPQANSIPLFKTVIDPWLKAAVLGKGHIWSKRHTPSAWLGTEQHSLKNTIVRRSGSAAKPKILSARAQTLGGSVSNAH